MSELYFFFFCTDLKFGKQPIFTCFCRCGRALRAPADDFSPLICDGRELMKQMLSDVKYDKNRHTRKILKVVDLLCPFPLKTCEGAAVLNQSLMFRCRVLSNTGCVFMFPPCLEGSVSLHFHWDSFDCTWDFVHFSKAALDVPGEFGNTKPLQIFNPLKILCLEERTPGVLMASKDTDPKGSAMNMIIPVAFIELDVREVLNGDQT